MYEQFRNDFLASNSNLSKEELNRMLEALDKISNNYDFERKQEIKSDSYTLPESVEMYLTCKKISGLSENTIKNYRITLNTFFKTVQKAPSEIVANDIRFFLYNYQKERNVSSRSLDKYREYIVRFFSWAVEEGYINTNPGKNISSIKHEEPPRVALTQIELEYLRNSCKTLREKAILEFLYSTGCRVSEMSAVKKKDINWLDNSVRLFGKGKKHRLSFINAKAEVAIKNYLNSRKDDSEFLFVSERAPHGQLSKDAYEKIIRNIVKRTPEVQGKHITPHTFRHTMATTALRGGMPITDISKLLGHEKIDTTMIYAKTSTEEIREGHKRFII